MPLLKSKHTEPLLDISLWNSTEENPFNFETYMASDAKFLTLKASQGNWEDRRFEPTARDAMVHRIPFGTYHFMDVRFSTPNACARLWANQIEELGDDAFLREWFNLRSPRTDITIHWLDVESKGLDTRSQEYLQWWMGEFFDEIEKHTQVRIGIYTNYYVWRDRIGYYPSVQNRDLWIPRYSVFPPKVPKEWKDSGWWIWQYTDKGPGHEYGAASKSIDMSRHKLPEEEWRSYMFHKTGDETDLEKRVTQLEAIALDHETRLKILEGDDGGEPPPPLVFDKFYKVIAMDGLTIRETPIDGDRIGAARYGEILMATDEGVPDPSGAGYWRHVKYGDIEGWSAGWWMEEVEGPPPPEDNPNTMWVRVTTTKLRVECVKGHDKSCSGKRKPKDYTGPPGKPAIEPWAVVVRYDKGDLIEVLSDGQTYSCMDTINTPTIKASGGKTYYRIPPGRPGSEAQFGKYPKGGFIDSSKVTREL